VWRRGNLVLVGDLLRSVSLLQYSREEKKVRSGYFSFICTPVPLAGLVPLFC
jgi:hypothetical protein